MFFFYHNYWIQIRQNLQDRQQMVQDRYRSMIIGMLWNVCIFVFYFHQFLFLFYFFLSANFLKWTPYTRVLASLPVIRKLRQF